MTDRELIQAYRKSGDAKALEPIIARYGSLVRATAAAQLETTDQVDTVSRAVFRVLGNRRRLSARTFLPGWLVRTTIFAAAKQRQLAGQNPAPTTPEGIALHALNRLPIRFTDAVVANAWFHCQQDLATEALRLSNRRFEKRIRKAQQRLSKQAKKLKLPTNTDTETLSFEFLHAAPPEIESWDPAQVAAASVPPTPVTHLAKLTLRSWSWLYWKRRFKALGAMAACLVALIAALAGFLAWAWQTGHLMAWVIPFASRQQLKEAPELATLPRDWNTPGLQLTTVTNRAGIFGPTNVWQAHFHFTPEQWEGMKPSHIKPTNLFSGDGKIVLRNPNAKRSGLAGVLGIEFNWTQANLEFGGHSFTNIAARYRGNGTYVNSLYGKKQSIKIDLNKTHPEQKLHGIDKLNFNNLVEDATFMHDALGQWVFRASGIAAPRTAYAWLTIEIEGQSGPTPRGLYLLLENVDQRFAKDRFGTSKTPIFKPVTPSLFADLGDEWADYESIYDLKTEATEIQKQQVIDFAHSLTHDDDDTFARRVETFLDLDQFSRYLASIVLIASYDGFLTNGQNFYMYLDPETNRFGFIPWDLDHAWGDFPFVGSASDRDQASIWHPWTGEHRLLERVMQVEAFRTLYRHQLESLLSNHFNSQSLEPRINSIAAVLQDPIKHDNPFRYSRFQKAVSDDWGDPPPTTQAAIRPINAIKRFIAARSASVREQLDGKSEGVRLPEMTAGPPRAESD